ncbi:hypothetical protein EYF80_048674 [Liparis tanakae]|uniref:Uncharacterized protein n=1 Tax=Liparis tanakae TaxID=230148 RepID=A0A4Z2FJ32_9TELE|nr:hypothetical protein EYF80_048674 [Liparis tanakae]
MWLRATEFFRVGSVQVNRTSVGVVGFSELAKLASRRPLHSDSSEKVRCRVRLGDCGDRRDQRSEVRELDVVVVTVEGDGALSSFCQAVCRLFP